MGYLSDYYAAKDAERPDGSVDGDEVPLHNGGRKLTSHPEDRALDPSQSDNPQHDHLMKNLDG